MSTIKPLIKDHMNPSEEMLQYINDYFILFQVLEQNWYEIYEAKNFGGDNVGYSGTLGEYGVLKEFKTVMKVGQEVWSPFVRAINLQRLFDPNYDLTNLYNFDHEMLDWFLFTLQKGFEAKEKITEWLGDINSKYKYNVINAAAKCSIKTPDKPYGTFQILKLHEFEEKNDDEGFIIIDEIFHLDSVENMIQYLKMHKELGNCLILGLVRDEKYEWRGTFYIFFSYQGILYTVDNQQRRINIDNTQGSRNPGKYIDRNYENVYLPYWLLFFEDNPGVESKLPVNTDPIYEITTITKTCEKESGIQLWLELFSYRILNYIYKNNEQIMIGMSRSQTSGLLTSSENDPLKYASPNSVSDYGRGSYLFEKYSSDVKAIVLSESVLPDVIGTKEYVTDVIEFNRMKESAGQMQKMIIEDFNKNALKVSKKIRKIIESKDKEWIIVKALKDLKYQTENMIHGSKIVYDNHGYNYGFGVHHPVMSWKKILNVSEKYDYEQYRKSDDINWFIYGYKDENSWSYTEYCYYCGAKKRLTVKLTFGHFREFIDFFEIGVNDIPKEMIQHLHRISSVYNGNCIIDDINPYDMLKDPWFSHGEVPYEWEDNDWYTRGDWENHRLVIYIRICKRCFNKYKRKAELEEKDEPIGYR